MEVAFLTHASPSMRNLEIAGLKHAHYVQHNGGFQVQRVSCAVSVRWNTPRPTLRNKPLLIPRRGVQGDHNGLFMASFLIALQSQNRCPNVTLLNRFLPF